MSETVYYVYGGPQWSKGFIYRKVDSNERLEMWRLHSTGWGSWIAGNGVHDRRFVPISVEELIDRIVNLKTPDSYHAELLKELL